MKIALIPLSLLALSQTALAEEEKNWSGEGELGYTLTSGNTDNETLTAKLGLDYKKNAFGNQFKVEALRTETEQDVTDTNGNVIGRNNEVTADRYLITDKLTYDLNERIYSFLNGRYEDDEFSGFQYQSNLTAGLGWKAIKTDTIKLDFEVGAGYQADKTDAGEKQDGASGRFFEDFSWKISETTEFTQSLLVEGGDDNTRTQFDAGLKVAINGSLSLKLSHQVKHNSDVAADVENYDRITTATLVYGF